MIGTLNAQIDELERALTERFEQHPDADVLRSLPGLGVLLGARVLGEFGDDPNRYADAKARKNYAGSAPITKQSGKRKVVLARFKRNHWLMPCTAGRSPPLPGHPAPARSTTSAAPPATNTTKPSGR